jgi:arylsulfate sulfotransferase
VRGVKNIADKKQQAIKPSESMLVSLLMRHITIFLCCLIFCGCKKEAIDQVLIDDSLESGKIYLAPFNRGDKTGALWVLDKDGNLLQQIATEGIAANLQQWRFNGGITRYTYLVEDNNGYHIPGFTGYIPGYQVIADENLNEIKRVYLSSFNDIDASVQNLLDLHDFILLSDDHYIGMAYYEKQVSNIPNSFNPAPGIRVIAPVIQEIKNGEVVWQWDATNYPELYSESVEGNNYSNSAVVSDYLHINSMAIDPKDGNLVCSFRNANLILKINRTTGAIMWRLGGKNSDFPLTEAQEFLRQHHASFVDDGSTLLLFDNGEINERPLSRILEFRLDEASRKVTSYISFNISGDFAQYMGSVQKRGDTYFIGGGSAKYIMEVDRLTGLKYFEMTLQKASYRSLKY